jgi:trehalose 6-phosphate synthase
MDAAERILGAAINRSENSVRYNGNTTRLESFPISVDFDSLSQASSSDLVPQEMDTLRHNLKIEDKLVCISIDRIDYTKGIPQRLQAVESFFSEYPSYQGRVVFIQAGMPSRTGISSYRNLGKYINELISRINDRFGTEDWQPLIEINEQIGSNTLNALRRMGNICIVSSLHDGMNLVAKEYIGARFDEDGVLILSEFTGAAEELKDAVLINPYDTTGFAEKIKSALEMPVEERKRRMRNLRNVVKKNNIYSWGAEILIKLTSLSKA